MNLKILLISAAILACALWPQGVVLCLGSEGHLEVDLEGAECCPSRSDDCVDCVDLTAPNQQITPSRLIIALPAARVVKLLPDDHQAASRIETSVPLLPPRESALEGVELLV